MSRDDWFRHTTWNEEVAAKFEAKLKRARRKDQYIRIQACTLARTHPEVALQLLERYFAEVDRFGDAQAHVDRATAFVALGRLEEAVNAYEEALRIEAKVPNLLTSAGFELPYLVALNSLTQHYDRALKILKESQSRITFPIEKFQWNAANALIAGLQKRAAEASAFARQALDAASKDSSGFRYHAKLGLVSKEHANALRQLRAYCDS